MVWAAFWAPVVAARLGLLRELRRRDAEVVRELAQGLEWFACARERDQTLSAAILEEYLRKSRR